MAALTLVAAVCVMASGQLRAESIDELFANLRKYVDEERYTNAMEELQWMQRELDKLHFEKVKSFFPDELAGFKGGDTKSQTVLGFANMSRSYGETGSQIDVALTGGASVAGGLAALLQMINVLGSQENATTFRLDGRTATLVSEADGSASLSVLLKSGSILTFEAGALEDPDLLRQAARAFPVAALDDYLAGR
jgi:hypothetical protein